MKLAALQTEKDLFIKTVQGSLQGKMPPALSQKLAGNISNGIPGLNKSGDRLHTCVFPEIQLQSWLPLLLHFHGTKCDMFGSYHSVFTDNVAAV